MFLTNKCANRFRKTVLYRNVSCVFVFHRKKNERISIPNYYSSRLRMVCTNALFTIRNWIFKTIRLAQYKNNVERYTRRLARFVTFRGLIFGESCRDFTVYIFFFSNFFSRVFWRRLGNNNVPEKNDTKETSLRISGLKDDLMYELVLKAGNSRGMSTLTEPIRFTTSEKDVMSAASMGKFIFSKIHVFVCACVWGTKVDETFSYFLLW